MCLLVMIYSSLRRLLGFQILIQQLAAFGFRFFHADALSLPWIKPESLISVSVRRNMNLTKLKFLDSVLESEKRACMGLKKEMREFAPPGNGE